MITSKSPVKPWTLPVATMILLVAGSSAAAREKFGQPGECASLPAGQQKQCALAATFPLTFPLGLQSYKAQRQAQKRKKAQEQADQSEFIESGNYGPYGYSKVHNVNLRYVYRKHCGRKCRKRKRISRRLGKVMAGMGMLAAAMLSENAGRIIGRATRSGRSKKGRKRRKKTRKRSRKRH